MAKPTPTSRRLPPPCWSDEETSALIKVYRDKWYSLRRGNLRAPDWQDVADGVAARCTLASPPKTTVQCRHKMEKLRKRYRSEIQRVGNGNRTRSSWVHFKLMESMELGLTSSDPVVNSSNRNDEEEDEDEEDLILNPNLRYKPSIATEGVRIKIPNFAALGSNNNIRLDDDDDDDDDLPPSFNKRFGPGLGSRVRNGVKRKEVGGNVMNEMVAAIQRLGDGFVKMERMKMEMARELESMRMKTEMEQTEMVLETHRKLWDSLSEIVVERKSKKVKRMATPEEG
ncbi:trihelix transcription factor ENAP1-like [Bidens hawaiensis]|uniref:trihelix transcription factor ENAP1-like n=1 Tax=Bidens hawaiensis TaxID=980011 RepID=UPI004049133D